MEQKRTISLIVTNVQKLESGLSAQVIFSEQGGLIGSASNADWQLKDSAGLVHSQHCRVALVDGEFCVEDHCGQTFVNGSHMPLGQGKQARLEHKHEISVGPYDVRVLLGHNSGDEQGVNSTLDQLFERDGLDLLSDTDDEIAQQDESSEEVLSDPILALDSLIQGHEKQPSLLENVSQEAQEIAQSSLIQHAEKPSSLNFTPQADSEDEMTSSIRLKSILGFGKKNKSTSQAQGANGSSLDTATIASSADGSIDEANKPDSINKMNTRQHTVAQESQPHSEKINSHNIKNSQHNASEGLAMDDKVLDLLEEEMAKNYQPQSETQDPMETNDGSHLLTGPMLKGLGVEVGNRQDMSTMHMLSEELGQSLQACVMGLLDVHQQVREGRFGVMNRNLQPIEDNPLRLGLSYEETVRTLYDTDKSVVHLSAPAAISESLKNIQDHNDAMQFATGEALSQILNAFSPAVLMRRFNHYKRNTDMQQQSTEAWAWEMYCNYYQELTSNRQKGFEKLFWEIFEQAYDRKIRDKQLEL